MDRRSTSARTVTVRRVALGMGFALASASLALLAVSLHYGDWLADWSLLGLAALAAIASNVAFMSAAKLRSP